MAATRSASLPARSEARPNFSPDGKWIAFTGNYDGNPNVYVVPATGGSLAASPIIPARISSSAGPPTAKIFFSLRRVIATRTRPAPLYHRTRRRVSHAATASHGLRRLLLADGTYLAYRPMPSVRQLEALSRRNFPAHLDRQSRRFQHRATPARQFQRFQSDVDRRHYLFPFRSQRPRHALFATTRNRKKSPNSFPIPAWISSPPPPARAPSSTNNSDRSLRSLPPASNRQVDIRVTGDCRKSAPILNM